MRKLLALILAICFIAPSRVLADALQPFSFVAPMTEQDGDTITTNQVAVSSSAATLLSAAVTNKTNRKRSFVNCGSFAVYIGTNTGTTTSLTTTGYRLSESTGTAPTYQTYDTAAFYATTIAGASSDTVCVMQETNSIP